MGFVSDLFTRAKDPIQVLADPAGIFATPDAPNFGGGGTTIPTFQGLTTPSFALNQADQGFDLTRRTPAPNFNQIFGRLGANTSNFLGLVPEVRGLSGAVAGVGGRTQDALGSSRLLQNQLQSTVPRLGALGNQVAGVGRRFTGLGSELAGVQEEIRPGFGRLTESQVRELRNREAASASNLRDTLAQRGLGGSSFALQEEQRQQLDFAQQESQVRGEAFERELAATRDIASLRAQVLAGEVGTAQEQRAVIADTRSTINNIGGLLQLDQQTLNQQANLIGVQLGLTEAQSNIFANQLANIQVQMQATQQQISNELNELGISGNIVNQVSAVASEVGIAQAKLTADAAASAGFLQIAQQQQQLSTVGSLAGLGITAFSSSRAIKDRDGPVDTTEALKALEALPVEFWRYKTDGISHVGTYAEDFRDQTGLGNGKEINVVDLTGMMLAAIQALSARVKELEAANG